jgi:lia operon protein LiaF
MKGTEGCGKHMGSWFAGLILVAIGTIFLLRSLGVIRITIWQIFKTYWPVALILLGISIIMRRSK